MKVLLFSDQEIWDILKLLAALLHIGNIKYKASVIGESLFRNLIKNDKFKIHICIKRYLNVLFISTSPVCIADNLDATEIPDLTNVQRVASLLGVPKQPLIDALTRKTLFAHGETVVSETSSSAVEYFF